MVQAEADALLAQPGAGVDRLRVGDLDRIIEAWDPTPPVVILAEIIAARAGCTGEALTHTTGRING
jgi:hypothetical protein